MSRGILTILTFTVLTALAGCAGSGQKAQLDPRVHLTVHFVDSGWDGQTVPAWGRCRDCGGEGLSPALRIGGLPPEATEVVVEFDDLSFLALSEDGGHGTLAIATGGLDEVVLPSVHEETMTLPQGVRCVRKHRCSPYGHEPGAFKAPCGCGNGNEYMATVMALRGRGDDEVLLAKTEIALGSF